MPVADSIKAQLDEAKYVMRRQMARIAELEAEVERLKAGLSAHGVLKQLYLNEAEPSGNRIKAASAAIGYEQPKLSVTAYVGQRDRREAWRIYEQWSLRREIMMKIKNPPPKGWDAHLQRDTYVEPPESEGMPPVDVVEDPTSGFKVLSNLLPKAGEQRRLGNGNGSDEDHS